ncbi:hypothetical protein [Propionivibrio limicola]|nr:hypothetical protein [Propionivibrio limicola]
MHITKGLSAIEHAFHRDIASAMIAGTHVYRALARQRPPLP